jgi:AcrR family transcriptional regulator
MSTGSSLPRAPEATRRRILDSAFAEFYKNGFQGGSLNHIVEMAGATKGALFHHFNGKQDLGYAVVDDIIGPLLMKRWVDPLTDSTDPISDIQRAFRRFVREDIETGSWLLGCPLNNLAQEMSPLDQGFQVRINLLYDLWRNRFAAALARGMAARTVKQDIVPANVSAHIVAAQMGIWGTGKSSHSETVMLQAAEGLCDYLDSLRP